jgi:molecular chaperone HscB
VLNRAIEVNDAFRRLKDPVRRAEALLTLLGIPFGQGSEPPPDPEFLMEVMERREALTEAAAERNVDAVAGLLSDALAWETAAIAELGLAFGAVPAEGDVPDAVQGRLRHALGRLRYARRFSSEARALETELE